MDTIILFPLCPLYFCGFVLLSEYYALLQRQLCFSSRWSNLCECPLFTIYFFKGVGRLWIVKCFEICPWGISYDLKQCLSQWRHKDVLVYILESSGHICASDHTYLQYNAFHCNSLKCFAKLVRAITRPSWKFLIKWSMIKISYFDGAEHFVELS